MFLPACTEDDLETKVYCKCSSLVSLPFEPVGRWFEACLKRQRSDKYVSIIDDVNNDQEEQDSDEEKELSEDDRQFLLSLDVKEWKKQDHYRVLGLEKLRFNATEEHIKKAYRKKVLRHHPDKKSNRTQQKQLLPPEVNEHEYFTCITRAYEVLSCVEKRQAFDSVDDDFDDTIPSFNPKHNDFFKTFSKCVTLNSRWSSHRPVPLLGDMNTSIDDVNSFYAFWYDFHSWRNFSNLDKEDTDQAESREERRWMEQENKKQRTKRKKEEISRIRKLTDTLFQNDPRLKKHRQEQKQKKLDEKLAKENIEQEKERQRQAMLEEERKVKEKAESEARDKALKEKKEKDKIKKTAAKDRKIIRQFVKTASYYDSDEVKGMDRLERAMENLSVQDLQELREATNNPNKSVFEELYNKQSNEVLKRLEKEKEEKIKQEEAAIAASNRQSTNNNTLTSSSTWTDLEKTLLVKATTLFPVGTTSRWEVIAGYINEHSDSSKPKSAKQIINKVKNLKKLDPSQKAEVNKQAFQTFQSSDKWSSAHISAEPSVKDVPVEVAWSSDEQKLLEQALKTYDSSTPERWESIASLIPSRTKKDCMKRYKELVEMVKAKKRASAK